MTEKTDKIKQIHGEDFFIRNGRKGGKKTGLKGFALYKQNDPEGFKRFYIEREARKRKV